MTRETEILDQLQDIFKHECRRLAGHRVVLFGSRARGDAKPRSDFDIAVVGATPLLKSGLMTKVSVWKC